MITHVAMVRSQLAEGKPKIYQPTQDDMQALKVAQATYENAEGETIVSNTDQVINANLLNQQKFTEDSDEIEKFRLEKDDRMIITCRSSDMGYIDCLVFNARHKEFFFHHQYQLPYLPLCCCPIDFIPRGEGKQGNFVAVSGMSEEIEIWNLDIMDQLQPDEVLGGSDFVHIQANTRSNKKKQIKNIKPESHKAPVLSLSWSQQHPNILASGSADGTIKLWELNSVSNVLTLSDVHTGGINIVQFDATQPQVMLSVGLEDQRIVRTDFKLQDGEQSQQIFQCDTGVENAQFFSSQQIVVTSSDGKVFLINQDRKVDFCQVHDKPLTALAVNHQGLVIVASPEIPRVFCFHIKEEKLVKLFAFETKIKIFSASFGQNELDFAAFLGSDKSRLMFFNVYAQLDLQFITQTLKVEVDLQHFKHRLLRFSDDEQQDDENDEKEIAEKLDIENCSFDEASGVFEGDYENEQQ